jgi:hypothetical protein
MLRKLTAIVLLGLCVSVNAYSQDEDQIEDLGLEQPGEEAIEEPGNTQVRRIIIPGNQNELVGRYSPTLKAYFDVRWFRYRNQIFPGARLLTQPEANSPLRGIPIHVGDVISRLDDIKVRSYNELERHYAETTVRYVRRANSIRHGVIYIDTDLDTP